MARQKEIEPLTGEELLHKVKELGNLRKEEKAKVCGYYSVTKSGLERVNMMQFLSALINAEGIQLDSNRKANEHGESKVSYQTTVQSNGSVDSNKIISVKPASKPIAKPKPLSQQIQQPEIEPVEQPEIEQPEQPEPPVHLESLAEPTRDMSVYSSGWSITELMNEFSTRASD